MFKLCWTCVNYSFVHQEVLAQEKAQASSTSNEEVDLDELMDVSRSINLNCILQVNVSIFEDNNLLVLLISGS